MTVEESVGRAVATAGQAVVFAGGTVVIAILGLAVAGIPFMTAGGIAISVIVLIMVVASVTLLPAFLGLAGHRINRLGLRRDRRAPIGADGGRRAGSVGVRTSPGNAWAYAVGVTVLLLALAAPVLALRLGIPDEGTLPETPDRAPGLRPRRRGLRSRASTARWSSPSTSRDDPSVVEPLRAAIAADEGIAAVAPARGRTPRPASRRWSRSRPPRRRTRPPSTPSSGSAPTCFPAVLDGSPARAHVGGQTASWADIGDRVNDRLPLFIAAVILLSFLLLTAGLPVGARAAQGGAAEPAEHRRRLRRDGHGVPVGLGHGPHRPGVDRADRPVHPHVHVRHPLRPLDGLRGVPALPGA